MGKILISGLINIETTVFAEKFPIEYSPVDYKFFGVNSSVSGVGINIAKAVKALGNEPVLFSLTGKDPNYDIIKNELAKNEISYNKIKPILSETPQSVILYDSEDNRKIIVNLKDIQETEYPLCENDLNELSDIDLAVMCNINLSRKIMNKFKEAGKIIATDLHVLKDINDEYNKEFLENADILFLSNEGIIGRENEFINELSAACHSEIIAIGMGEKGALLYIRSKNEIKQYNAVKTRKVVNTIGAGDALFSAFLHFYIKYGDPNYAMKSAVVFASYKIGEKGAANGFLSEEELLMIPPPTTISSS